LLAVALKCQCGKRAIDVLRGPGGAEDGSKKTAEVMLNTNIIFRSLATVEAELKAEGVDPDWIEGISTNYISNFVSGVLGVHTDSLSDPTFPVVNLETPPAEVRNCSSIRSFHKQGEYAR